MTKIPKPNGTVDQIYSLWETKGASEKRRGYLGVSSLGSNCKRKLWYGFRHCDTPDFTGKTYRLFNRGHLEENRFVQDLKDIGCEVHEFDADGEQFEVSAINGHLKGHTDGLVKGLPESPETWHLLEFKTSNQNSFNKLKKNGLEKANFVHYVQMQVYMALMDLTRGMYLVVNKNDESIYSERIKIDNKLVQQQLSHASTIIDSSLPPEKISEDSNYFECKWCPSRDLCHGTSDIAVPITTLSCRQCVYSSPIEKGEWKCSKHDKIIDGTPCRNHLLLPSLITFADATDVRVNSNGDEVMEYTKKDGTIFESGGDIGNGQYSSQLLTYLGKDLSTKSSRGIEAMHEIEKEKRLLPLQDKYNSKNKEVDKVWSGDTRLLRDAWNKMIKVPMGITSQEEEGESWYAIEFGSDGCIIVFNTGYSEIRTINKN